MFAEDSIIKNAVFNDLNKRCKIHIHDETYYGYDTVSLLFYGNILHKLNYIVGNIYIYDILNYIFDNQNEKNILCQLVPISFETNASKIIDEKAWLYMICMIDMSSCSIKDYNNVSKFKKELEKHDIECNYKFLTPECCSKESCVFKINLYNDYVY